MMQLKKVAILLKNKKERYYKIDFNIFVSSVTSLISTGFSMLNNKLSLKSFQSILIMILPSTL